jgi:O-antigen biosynthesis protein
MTSSRISIVVPCHNAAPYLAQALGSALDQQRPPDEIVVVDDGSTDDSLVIARRFATAVPSIVRVHAGRFGAAARTRNVGALLATGDRLMFLDADDVLRPDTLGALEQALQAAPAGVAICPWFRLVHRGGEWIQRPASCAPRLGRDALAAWLTGWYHPPCSVLWSRDGFERAGRWDDQALSNDDGDLMMRALAMGFPIVETADGAGFYRRRVDGEPSLSGQRFTRASLADRTRLVRKIAFILREAERLDPYRPALEAAFRLIRRDAGQAQPDLARQAEALARHYGPAKSARLARRWGARPARPSPAPAAAGHPEPAVEWGLSRAAAVLELVHGTPETLTPAAGIVRPAVSIIVPTYNRAALLPRALDSVFGQTFADFEVIVVDDGSTDDTAAVVARYGDPRLRLIRQPVNAGVAAARNRGLREVRADLVAFLDSDDEWVADKLAQQVDVFRKAPDEVGLVYTGVECVLPDGRRRTDLPEARGDVYRRMLARNVVHGGGSNVMMRRSVVATVGFFDETLRAIEDYEYWLRIARFFKVDCVDAPLIRYYDPQTPERRSQALRANLEAREWFFRKHAPEMRRARVAHLFILKSMRRALGAQRPDVGIARRLALRAVREAPTSRAALSGLLQAFRSHASGGAS